MEQHLDEIRIDNLKIFAHHGYFPEEKKQGQDFYINAVLYTDLRCAGISDQLTQTVHYGIVCQYMDTFMKENTFDLIETVAEKLARGVLLAFPGVRGIDLEIRKPNAPIPLEFQSVSVKIHRRWHDVFLALGSNMGDKEGFLNQAVKSIRESSEFCDVEVSPYRITKPYGMVEQDDFLNAVLRAKTLLTPQELLEFLQHEESVANRKREIHWGPRTLDLDILFYDQRIVQEKNLTIPHPDMKNRVFVLAPMVDLAPYYVHPVYRKTMRDMLQELIGD